MKAKRLIWIVAVLLLITSAPAIAQKGSNVVMQNNARGSSSLNYWSPEQMAAAKPRGLARPGAPQRASADAATRAIGPATAINGGAPGQDGIRKRERMLHPLPAASAVEEQSPLSHFYNYPYPYTRTEVFPGSLYNDYPWSTNGKLFFTIPGQGNFVCSATAVASGSAPRRALVLTAGHCVSQGDGATWATNFLFCPARRDYTNPYGCWDWQSATTTSEWFSNGNFKRDVGFIVTSKDANGRSLGDVVGDAGIAWNFPDKVHFWDHGYPSAAPFDGERMILCTASTSHRDSFSGAGPDPVGIGCDMTPGASGGSLKISSGMVWPGWANGVNSYKYSTQPEAMYSPYFDGEIGDLWNFATSQIEP